MILQSNSPMLPNLALTLITAALTLPAHAAITRDRGCVQGGGDTTTSLTCDIGSTTAGAAALWMVSDQPGARLTVVVDSGSPLTPERTFPWNSGGLRIQLFAVPNLGPGTHTFRASWSRPVPFPTMTIDLFNGVAVSSFIDSTSPRSSSLTCASLTTTTPAEHLWAAGVVAAGGVTLAPANGYHGYGGYSSNVITEENAAPTPGTYTPAFTGDARHPATCIAATLRPYIPTTASPAFTPDHGTYGPAQAITLSSSSPNATLYYTTDGSNPTTHSPVYSTPIAITTHATLKALATAPGLPDSPITSATYAIVGSRTWYARVGGGDRTQCTGLSPAQYSGSGSGQTCAFADPAYFYEDGHGTRAWVGVGGDTYDLDNHYPRGDTGWRVGWRNPTSAADGRNLWGVPGDNQHSFIPSLPPGTPGHPTSLRGAAYASCTTKSQLFAGFGARWLLSLDQPYLQLDCLELTTHNTTNCQISIPGATQCKKDAAPLSDFAFDGIETNINAHDILLKNVDIHGFDNSGIRGPIGLNITFDHLRIAFNGMSGWNFDPGGPVPTSLGSASGSHLLLEGNGCYEQYPITGTFPARKCYGQERGGYGDAVGTPDNFLLSFSCDHCIIRYNTQDGLDLLHTKGGTNVITNSSSYGNAGQQWKFGPQHAITFTNNYTGHFCNRLSVDMPGATPGSHLTSDLCRAAGDMFAFAIQGDRDDPTAKYIIANNTFVTYGLTAFDISYCSSTPCSKPKIFFVNNLIYGYQDPVYGSASYPGIFNFGANLDNCFATDGSCSNQAVPPGIFAAKKRNIYYRVKSCPTDEPACSRTTDPHLANAPAFIPGKTSEAVLDAIDPHLTPGSSIALRQGSTELTLPAADLDAKPRSPSAPSIGAYEPRQ